MQGPGLRSLVSYYTSRVPQLRPQLSKIKKKKKKLKTSKTQTANIKASIQRNKMNWFTNQAEVQLFSLFNRVSHSKTKQIGLFQRKSPKRRNKVPNCTHPQRDLRLLFGACLLPNIDSLLQLPSAGTTSAASGSFEGRASGQMVLPAARALPPNSPTVSQP